MTETNLGQVSTFVKGDRLILALDKKWIEVNNGKPLEFEIILNEKNLVLSTTLGGEKDRTNVSTRERIDNNVM